MTEVRAPDSFVDRYGPWALVAGASEGIGASFARQIAGRGLHLVLVARRSEPLEQLASEIRHEHGIAVRTATLDLTGDGVLGALTDITEDVDVGLLVYNAGATHGASAFHDDPLERSLGLVRLNCVGPVVLTHHFGRLMAARRRGGIMLMTSVSAVAGAALTATYSATKAFDEVLAEGLWAELRPHGVDVLALVAGATRTPAMERSGALIGSAEFPGMDPDEVASEGLTHLGDGPTWVAGEENRAAFDYLRGLPRADAVALMSAGARAIYGFDDEP